MEQKEQSLKQVDELCGCLKLCGLPIEVEAHSGHRCLSGIAKAYQRVETMMSGAVSPYEISGVGTTNGV
jgi:hypothetical protein